LRREADTLHFAPCPPADWDEFKVHYRHRKTLYHITVRQTRAHDNRSRVTVDGIERSDNSIPLVDDGAEHAVEIRIHATQTPALPAAA
jgi:cellobiose phosphorylase